MSEQKKPAVEQRKIERLAIVNRGEAAVRCLRTAKSLRALEGGGLEVVALFTPPDRDTPFVRQAVSLRDLYRLYSDQVKFMVIYIRELELAFHPR